ncbi:MAG: O-antigen ligase family protein [bacterium]
MKKERLNIQCILIVIILFSGSSVLADYRNFLIILLPILAFIERIICSSGKFKVGLKGSRVFLLLVIVYYCLFQTLYVSALESLLKYLVILMAIAAFWILKVQRINFIEKLIKYMNVYTIIISISILITVVYNEFIFDVLPFMLPSNISSLSVYKNELINGNFSGISLERSYAAFAMVVCIIINLSNYTTPEYNIKNNKKSLFAVFLAYIALFCTGKRMLFFVAILVSFIIFLIHSTKIIKTKLLKASFLLIFITLIIMSVFPDAGRVFDRLLDMNTFDTRIDNYWKYCYEMFVNNPLFGNGINTFVDYITPYRNNEIYNAHNIYFQLLGEVGIIGFTIFMYFFISNLTITYKLLRKSISLNDSKNVYYLKIFYCIQILFLTYGISGNTLYYFSQLYIYMISIYCVMVIQKKCIGDEKK